MKHFLTFILFSLRLPLSRLSFARLLFSSFIFSSLLFSESQSAFGAGNLYGKSSYGLNKTEKAIFSNIQSLKEIETKLKISKIRNLQQITKIKDDISSLKNLLLSNSKSSNKNKIEINKKLNNLDSSLSSLTSSFLSLKDILIHINDNFISKEELKEEIKKIIALSLKIKDEPSNTMAKKAYKLFKRKQYEQSYVLYSELLRRNYMPARSNFYLGESSYFQKKYSNAIKFYEKSVHLYDKAKYMPTLLYHSGVSYSKINKSKEARKLFKALTASFPKSNEALSLK